MSRNDEAAHRAYRRPASYRSNRPARRRRRGARARWRSRVLARGLARRSSALLARAVLLVAVGRGDPALEIQERSRALFHLSRVMMRGMAALRAAGRYCRYSAK